ncbi:MAG TPA: multicopper oxidase domain-containing protein, partial [Bryobacteraceae bacterium]|nr:multicopper oxidase domain-containing protein [Bryobacteraceae bacterium]
YDKVEPRSVNARQPNPPIAPSRREFLASSAAFFFDPQVAADFTLRIAEVNVAISPRKSIRTVGYNGSVPGPVLRLPEGRAVTVDVINETSDPELVHWHGLFTPVDADGSAEEGTPMVPARGQRRYTFTPRPSGTRWYHSHVYAGKNLRRSTYTGQYGVMILEPRDNPARYDQEIVLALHGWDPFLSTHAGGGEGDEGSLEVHYNAFTVNSHALGAGEPVRVRQGQRALFRIVNANATLTHRLALPGHKFTVVALDGNAVPRPATVSVLELGAAERIDAVVEMNQPGVWILGDANDQVRNAGLGVVLEYANSSGEPQWLAPPNEMWDYTLFGRDETAPEPTELRPLVFKQKWVGNRTIDHWTINGKEYPKTDPIRVRAGGRYRLVFDNQSGDMHPVHLHRHSFELIRIAGKPTRGVMKDVVGVMPRTKVEVDVVADNPGPSLFHCHMQLHMDFGFMTLMEYEGQPAPPPMIMR